MTKFSRVVIWGCAAFLLLVGMGRVSAAPWVDTSDIYLRADIQALADAGVITVPVNTYPLMWAGIGKDLANAEPGALSPALMQAYERVNFYYRNAVQNRGNTHIKASLASDPARFQHFGADYREKGQLSTSYEYLGERFAFKSSGSLNYDPVDGEKYHLDDTYLAGVFGNWVVTGGTLPMWWGPGFDTGLIKSTNARPMPSIMLSRNDSHGFETPWLSWIGPWTLTAGLSMFEKERYAPHALLWNMRATIRPFKQLEIGGSWTTQFCGEGQECGADIFFKALTGQRDCRLDDGTNGCSSYGNQMAGFDVRYSDTLANIPFGLYVEKTCEDSMGPYPWNITDCGYLWGADTRFGTQTEQYKLFIEYTNTMVACDGGDKNSFNCFYEHATYKSGSRYYGRSLGSTYDSDSKVMVLGLIGQFQNSHGLKAFLRYAELNKDRQSPQNGWAPVIPTEDLLMLELSYRLPIWHGMLSFGGAASHSKYDHTQTSDTYGSVFGSFEYRF